MTAGPYKRKLMTKAGEVELKMTRLLTLPFETAIIQRYQKREIRLLLLYLNARITRICDRRTKIDHGRRAIIDQEKPE